MQIIELNNGDVTFSFSTEDERKILIDLLKRGLQSYTRDEINSLSAAAHTVQTTVGIFSTSPIMKEVEKIKEIIHKFDACGITIKILSGIGYNDLSVSNDFDGYVLSVEKNNILSIIKVRRVDVDSLEETLKIALI